MTSRDAHSVALKMSPAKNIFNPAAITSSTIETLGEPQALHTYNNNKIT